MGCSVNLATYSDFFFSIGIWCYIFAEASGTFIKDCDHVLRMAAC